MLPYILWNKCFDSKAWKFTTADKNIDHSKEMTFISKWTSVENVSQSEALCVDEDIQCATVISSTRPATLYESQCVSHTIDV